ncbi:molybdopterin molybdotransferase MoeA|uniref:Molybdopterin molybdenumtransferase n=1 Tax=Dendrosporobacter quercicolus TaxID=146817 RepID=A0A1G9NGX6_9FIRM|nr:gephyrin-like molybdotransferase Glp [Dendrosporobacter quercicolus]NSL47326.1 molybdopterin molybdotransferase MoeA [Dendrosporobacter quercicolus DSM 1736]SDL85357.1 molybdopterin molybdotransferase [Dendrosporobacter quercicolus]
MAILLEQACSLLQENSRQMPVVELPLAACYGRILAQNTAADIDFPPFARSPLDGYAVRFADVKHATADCPVSLEVIDDVPAGMVPRTAVRAGTAVRIMTGAKIPAGADAVIRLEDTVTVNGFINIITAAGADRNICRQGEEFKQGAVLLTPGSALRDGALGILAMFGQDKPRVYEKPRVAILATGTEIVAVNQLVEPGKIRDSNSYMLAAKVLEAGGEPVLLGQVRDNIDDIEQRLEQAADIDLYLTTGGASVGDYDLMRPLFERLSVRPLFSRVAIKPGMPVLAGCWRDRLLIGLSGNPAAAGVSFELLIRPLVRRMAGVRQIERPRAAAVLQQKLVKTGPVRRFVWAECIFDNGRLAARPLLLQSNGMMAGLLEANALLDIPAFSPPLVAGATVAALLL